jgi:hypothetical protein
VYSSLVEDSKYGWLYWFNNLTTTSNNSKMKERKNKQKVSNKAQEGRKRCAQNAHNIAPNNNMKQQTNLLQKCEQHGYRAYAACSGLM